MNQRKTTLTTAIAIALGSCSFSISAALTTGATLNFTLGVSQVVACAYGTTPPCNVAAYNVTDIVGSYFGVDGNNGTIEANEKIPISGFNGIHIGTTQLASGSHTGSINGTENPDIDNPWTFFGNTGMHQTTIPITVISDFGSTKILDFSGWNVTWNGIASIPLGEVIDTEIVCSTSTCSDSSSYTLDGLFVITGGGFTNVTYSLHLEGHVSNVPIPAAAWLFGSGMLGLIGIARKKKVA